MIWLGLAFIGMALSLWAQFRVKSNFRRYAEIPAYSGMTGAEVARRILDMNGLYDVHVDMVPGTLTDHYDPTARVIRLSEPVYSSSSIAAVSVAAHECGHAIQHKEEYGALVFRHRLVPMLNFSSGLAPWLFMGGILLKMTNLIWLGVILFAAVVLFHLVTLPVEFNASARAKDILVNQGMVALNEKSGVDRVLNAAALTYVGSAVVALGQLLYYLSFLLQGNDD
ncbi:zinc metallopeptidase [Thermoflavimicrobium daqui]|jgi:Zn-dependent membrane protease YugP|uniref:Peptidase n=1 Tax=Thermoflavimicrobium daqui TaxID=2137476 RepID=A0A364K6R8_9BACL|nr:zinc metallopeptidase [Thermoflavimicrobium daqui]RAL25902.1 peptidase [Thermoflavimicrobium daqui]